MAAIRPPDRISGNVLPWTTLCVSLAGLAALMAWSAYHPVPAPPVAAAPVAPDDGATDADAAAAGVRDAGRAKARAAATPVAAMVDAPSPASKPAPRAIPVIPEHLALFTGSVARAPLRRSLPVSPPLRAAAVAAPSWVASGSAGMAVATSVAASVGVGAPATPPDADARRAQALAVLSGLSRRLRFGRGAVVPVEAGTTALEAMAIPLRRYADTDITVEVTGRELDSIAEDRALARARAGGIVDRMVGLGLDRGRFLVRLRPGVAAPTPGQRVRILAGSDGA